MAQQTCAKQTSALPYSCLGFHAKNQVQAVPRPEANLTEQLACLQSKHCPACRIRCPALICMEPNCMRATTHNTPCTANRSVL